ncbi:serine protease [Gemmata sp. JC673]|uniref:Serine protease n=1 Tax=Gemmata algarum TaxID=2975278 RepID=A0ABU5F0W7_9BACT|nr:serine protease [Gemmata algarum]MDY3559738.1 serine protease [Gemmata algarum]
MRNPMPPALPLALLLGCAVALGAVAQPPKAEAPREPKFVDDDAVYNNLYEKLEELAEAKKPLAHTKLLAKIKPGSARVAAAEPGVKALTPEEVYRLAEPGVFIVGSVYPDKDGNWETGTYATAWVAAADGVLVTNWHVFEDLKGGEVFGAADRNGNVYPVTDFLGGDKTADVAVFRIPARGLVPLAVSPAFAEVGSWVGVLSHPGDLFYVYTQGAVTRYSTYTNENKQREKWMSVTADYASGSSGGPVLNKYGAVVGMAALTLNIDAADEAPQNPARRKPVRPVGSRKPSRANEKRQEQKDDKPKPPEKHKPQGSSLQMVVKMTVPGPIILKWVNK